MTFVILHLSDSHFGKPEHALDSESVIETFLIDVKKIHDERNLTPDLIVFTGDVAYGQIPESPIEHQYSTAARFLERVHDALDSRPADIPVLLVPGNHDVDRTEIARDQTAWLLTQTGQAGVDEINSLVERRDAQWRRIRSRQAAWDKFANPLNQRWWSVNEELGMVTGVIENDDIGRVAVAGLNSAWASHGKNDKDHLWLGRPQLDLAIRETRGADLRLVAMHHPVSWLNDAEDAFVDERLESNFHVRLHGHQHFVKPIQRGRHLVMSAGALYQPTQWINAYSWVLLEPDMGGTAILRRFEIRGTSGWIPYAIPSITDEDGVCVWDAAAGPSPRHDRPEGAPKGALTKEIASGGNHLPPSDISGIEESPHSPLKVAEAGMREAAEALEGRFDFRWEPHGCGVGERDAVVYWPVSVRPPTPIHAVQAFAAAILQRAGGRVILCLDDLGHEEYDPSDMHRRFGVWFERAGAEAGSLEMLRFRDILETEAPETFWSPVRTWLGLSQYRLYDVLRISKIARPRDLTALSIADQAAVLQDLSVRRPRRLLTAPMVWACLRHLERRAGNRRIVTLGGYDEVTLWNAWRDLFKNGGDRVSHLYAPELVSSDDDDAGRPIHMSRASSLSWVSKQDIRRSLTADAANSTQDDSWALPHRLTYWCFVGCVLLPRFAAGLTPPQGVLGISSSEELVAATLDDFLSPLVDELARWLL